jgi:hypothetical protein
MNARLPSLLFSVTLGLAILMTATVVAAPYVLGERTDASDLLLLFARDMTVRRTAFFASLGLMATAFIFFRPAGLKKKKKEPGVNMTGA